jgi:hypothetical protein
MIPINLLSLFLWLAGILLANYLGYAALPTLDCCSESSAVYSMELPLL